jgi:uncharacterized Zn-finger protein
MVMHNCTECDYQTPKKSTLNVHLRTHTGEKPFQCPHCEYKTGDKSHLNAHLRKHTGEKPFECPHCEYTARHKSSLNVHLRKHAGEKPFECTVAVAHPDDFDLPDVHEEMHSWPLASSDVPSGAEAEESDDSPTDVRALFARAQIYPEFQPDSPFLPWVSLSTQVLYIPVAPR